MFPYWCVLVFALAAWSHPVRTASDQNPDGKKTFEQVLLNRAAAHEKNERELSFIKSLAMQDTMQGKRLPKEIWDEHISPCLGDAGMYRFALRTVSCVVAEALNAHGNQKAWLCDNGRVVSLEVGDVFNQRSYEMPHGSAGSIALSTDFCAVPFFQHESQDNNNGVINLLELKTNTIKQQFKNKWSRASRVIGLHISPCERATLSVTQGGAINVWSNASGRLIRECYDERAVTAVAFAGRASKYIATANTESNVIHLWNMEQGSVQKFVFGGLKGICKIALSSNGTMIALQEAGGQQRIGWAEVQELRRGNTGLQSGTILDNPYRSSLGGFLHDDMVVVHDPDKVWIQPCAASAGKKAWWWVEDDVIYDASTASCRDVICLRTPCVKTRDRIFALGVPHGLRFFLARARMQRLRRHEDEQQQALHVMDIQCHGAITFSNGEQKKQRDALRQQQQDENNGWCVLS